jgi:dihydrofolate reductase
MAKVVASITTSVDGYITGPDDGPGKGLGEGGERLHYWVFGGPWSYDDEPRGGPSGEDAEWLAEASARIGAVVAGRWTYEAARTGATRTRGGCRSSSSPTAPEEQPEGDAFVDELAVIVAPVVLGGGKRLFEGFSSGSRASRRSSTTGCGRRRAP